MIILPGYSGNRAHLSHSQITPEYKAADQGPLEVNWAHPMSKNLYAYLPLTSRQNRQELVQNVPFVHDHNPVQDSGFRNFHGRDCKFQTNTSLGAQGQHMSPLRKLYNTDTRDITMSAWIYPDPIPGYRITHCIGGWGGRTTVGQCYLEITGLTPTVTGIGVKLRLPGVQSRYALWVIGAVPKRWIHVCATIVRRVADGDIRLYIDGIFMNSLLGDLQVNNSDTQSTVPYLHVGSRATNAVDGWTDTPIHVFRGGISDFTIWRRALGSGEVKSLHDNSRQFTKSLFSNIAFSNPAATAGIYMPNSGLEAPVVSVSKIKPKRDAEIDRNNPISKGLVSCMLFNNYGNKRLVKDLVNDVVHPIVGSDGDITWSTHDNDTWLKLDGSGTWAGANIADDDDLGIMSVTMKVILPSSGYSSFASLFSSGSTEMVLYRNGNDNRWHLSIGGTVLANWTTVTDIWDDGVHMMTVIYDVNTDDAELWIDGVLESDPPTLSATDTPVFTSFKWGESLSFPANAEFSCGYVHKRWLGSAEIMSLHKDPFQIVKEKTSPVLRIQDKENAKAGFLIPEAKVEMPTLFIPKSKPTGPVKIDWGNPLTEGLKHYSIYTPLQTACLVTGNPMEIEFSTSDEQVWRVRQGIMGRGNNATTGQSSGHALNEQLSTFTWLAQAWPGLLFNARSILGVTTGGADAFNDQHPMCFRHGDIFALRQTTSLIQQASAADIVPSTAPQIFGADCTDGVYDKGWLNGIVDVTFTATNNANMTMDYMVQGVDYTAGLDIATTTHWTAAWDRVLTSSEHLTISKDPYQFLIPE